MWPAIAAAAASVGGALLGDDRARKIANRQMDLQREFAQMGIRWRVADAKAAGIHPLFALGASTPGYSPISTVGGSGIPELLQSMGQDLMRSQTATSSQGERDRLGEFAAQQERASDARVAQQRLLDLNMINLQHDIQGKGIRNDNAMLENELLRMQVRRALSQSGPPLPVPEVKLKPSEQTMRDPAVPGREAFQGEGKPGMVPYRLGGKSFGFTLDVPSSEFGEGLEGAGPAAWALGAAGIGGHYTSKFLNWINDEYGGRTLQEKVYRYLQDRGVYPRRKGM